MGLVGQGFLSRSVGWAVGRLVSYRGRRRRRRVWIVVQEMTLSPSLSFPSLLLSPPTHPLCRFPPSLPPSLVHPTPPTWRRRPALIPMEMSLRDKCSGGPSSPPASPAWPPMPA